MHFLGDTSFVTASYYPTSFYPSFAEAAAFKIPATQLSQSGTRRGVDCLNDRQVLQKGNALYCRHVYSCNHRGDIHDGPGISGFLAISPLPID
jgi:hypothetical protein